VDRPAARGRQRRGRVQGIYAHPVTVNGATLTAAHLVARPRAAGDSVSLCNLDAVWSTGARCPGVAIVLDVYRALVGSVGETPFVTTSDDVAAARLRTDYPAR
jgi:hypothetical protein